MPRRENVDITFTWHEAVAIRGYMESLAKRTQGGVAVGPEVTALAKLRAATGSLVDTNHVGRESDAITDTATRRARAHTQKEFGGKRVKRSAHTTIDTISSN